MVEVHIFRKPIILKILLDATKDARMLPGQIIQDDGGPKLSIYQLQIKFRVEHVFYVGFVCFGKLGISENSLLLKQLHLVKVFNALLIALLVVDKDCNVKLLLSTDKGNEC